MTRILLMGLFGGEIALSRVLREVAGFLKDRLAVSIYGFDSSNRQTAETAINGCRAFVSACRHSYLIADQKWLDREFADAPPDCVLVIGPLMIARPLLQQLQSYRLASKIVLYAPTEGQIVAPEVADILATVDLCITFTESAAADLRGLARPPAPLIRSVGVGIDAGRFFPKDVSRAEVFRGLGIPDNAFVVLNTNRPYLRKRLDLAILGFGEFATSARDALILNTGPRKDSQEADLRSWIHETGAADRIVLIPSDPQGQPMSDGALNDLYNCCDVGLSTAMGEGWGLTCFEHAITGHAQVVPDHTSFRENWTGAAVMMPCGSPEFIFYEYADMFPPSPQAVASALHLLYGSADLRRAYAEAGRARATEGRFTWRAVGERVIAALSELPS